jgi:DNA-binding HxlR family transcriptional regulator
MDDPQKGYGQFCPISVAAEIVAKPWTPLVLRELCCGATRYRDIRHGLPRMSSALLSRRLRELEHARIIDRLPAAGGKGHEYRLTEAGAELFPVLEDMGWWAQKWLRREITDDRHLDPDVLMWEIRRAAIDADRPVEDRRVVRFELTGQPPERRFYWLVFEPGAVDICVRDPGHELDLWITATLRTLVEIWVGHRGLDAALGDGRLRLDGSPAELRAFRTWFRLSHFAGSDERPSRRGPGPRSRRA